MQDQKLTLSSDSLPENDIKTLVLHSKSTDLHPVEVLRGISVRHVNAKEK